MRKLVLFVVLAMFMSVGGAALAADRTPDPVRVATFNASLNRFNAGDLGAELAAVVSGGAPGSQLSAVLEIIAINDPDVLLVNEFDYAPGNAELMAQITGYPYSFAAPSNTGIPSGFDLDNSGTVGGPNDALGFGFFPGQFGMLAHLDRGIKRIHIDVDNYILEAKLTFEEIAERRDNFKPLVKPLKSKWLRQYRALVTNASSGAVLEAE